MGEALAIILRYIDDDCMVFATELGIGADANKVFAWRQNC